MRISDWSSDVCSSDLTNRSHSVRKPRRRLSAQGNCTARRAGAAFSGRGNSPGEIRRSDAANGCFPMNVPEDRRSEEHTSELQSLMRISYAVFCLKKKKKKQHRNNGSSQ